MCVAPVIPVLKMNYIENYIMKDFQVIIKHEVGIPNTSHNDYNTNKQFTHMMYRRSFIPNLFLKVQLIEVQLSDVSPISIVRTSNKLPVLVWIFPILNFSYANKIDLYSPVLEFLHSLFTWLINQPRKIF